MLHHTVTIYLLVGSYLINIWECGAIISYIHDASDILGHLIKATGQTNLDFITYPGFFTMMGVWFYMRNLMLPFCIYHVWVQSANYGVFDREVFENGVTRPIYCYLLSSLVLLYY